MTRYTCRSRIRYPPEEHSIFHIDIFDSLVDNVHEILLADFPEIISIRDEFQCFDCDGIHDICAVCAEIDACLHDSDFGKFYSADLHAVNSGSKNSIFACIDSTRFVLNFAIDSTVNSDSTGFDVVASVLL